MDGIPPSAPAAQIPSRKPLTALITSHGQPVPPPIVSQLEHKVDINVPQTTALLQAAGRFSPNLRRAWARRLWLFVGQSDGGKIAPTDRSPQRSLA